MLGITEDTGDKNLDPVTQQRLDSEAAQMFRLAKTNKDDKYD